MATLNTPAHFSTTIPRHVSPNCTTKTNRLQGVRCALSPPSWRESRRRLVSFSLALSHLLFLPNTNSRPRSAPFRFVWINWFLFLLGYHLLHFTIVCHISNSKLNIIALRFYLLIGAYGINNYVKLFVTLNSWSIGFVCVFVCADATAGSLLDKYVKK